MYLVYCTMQQGIMCITCRNHKETRNTTRNTTRMDFVIRNESKCSFRVYNNLNKNLLHR